MPLLNLYTSNKTNNGRGCGCAILKFNVFIFLISTTQGVSPWRYDNQKYRSRVDNLNNLSANDKPSFTLVSLFNFKSRGTFGNECLECN